MKTNNILYISGLLLLVFLMGCKREWLEVKPDKGLSVPQTLADFQAILDDQNVMNRQYAFISNAGTDNIYVADADAGGFGVEYDRNQYTWDPQINWMNESANEWNHPFTVIGSANIVLNGIEGFSQSDPVVKNLKGQALFYRAYAYYTLAQVFCKQYDPSKAQTDLGLPLRLSSDVNRTLKRSSLQEVYNLIINDLSEATKLLPESGEILTRQTITSAQGLLSRVYLNMGDYSNAKMYADMVLEKRPLLLDFNNTQLVSPSKPYRFPANGIGNPEIISYMYSIGGAYRNSLLGSVVQASQQLYDLYDNNDLRKQVFFGKSGNKLNFVGCYTGTAVVFGGIATNEIYLIRAECYARDNKLYEAQQDLNFLLKNRYKTGMAPVITSNDQIELLRIILTERRKELPRYGNSRWEDLRRLNLDPKFAITQSRTFLGKTYTIEPNSPRYVLNIPNNEIRLSGIEQNLR